MRLPKAPKCACRFGSLQQSDRRSERGAAHIVRHEIEMLCPAENIPNTSKAISQVEHPRRRTSEHHRRKVLCRPSVKELHGGFDRGADQRHRRGEGRRQLAAAAAPPVEGAVRPRCRPPRCCGPCCWCRACKGAGEKVAFGYRQRRNQSQKSEIRMRVDLRF